VFLYSGACRKVLLFIDDAAPAFCWRTKSRLGDAADVATPGWESIPDAVAAGTYRTALKYLLSVATALCFTIYEPVLVL
jgi:hypothetical protein